MPTDFGDIFQIAKVNSLRLNNLYQMDDGMFRANFRDCAGWFSPMSENADPRAALEAALEIALAHLAKHPRKPAANGFTSNEDGELACIKCGAVSGDSWSECEGHCPVPSSPHYDPAWAKRPAKPAATVVHEHRAEAESRGLFD